MARDPKRSAVEKIVEAIRRLMAEGRSPVIAALDGRSGSGKSTLAALVAQELDAVVVPSDLFFAGRITDAQWDARTPAARAQDAIDWRRLRGEALEPLCAGKPARWHALDFDAGARPDGTYAMRGDSVECRPADVIVLDGAYCTRPELADLIDLTVLVEAPEDVRRERLALREDEAFLRAWHGRWDAAEDYYFTQVRPRSAFDLVVPSDGAGA